MTWYAFDPPVQRLPDRPVIEREGIRVQVPPGWEIRVRRAEAAPPEGRNFPVMHGATIPLPEERGDYGSGVVDRLDVGDVFVSVIEFGEEAVGSALFPVVESVPLLLLPEDFHPSQLQQIIPGQAGAQRFFTLARRAFCIYAVLGAFSRRAFLAPQVRELLATLEVGDGS